MRVLKANKDQFEQLHSYIINNNQIKFVKDIDYNWVCGVGNRSNPNFKAMASVLNAMEEIDYTPCIDLQYIEDEDKLFIEVPPAGSTGLARANKISTELYNIELPKAVYNDNNKAFRVLEVSGKHYLQIDPLRIFHVHTEANLDELIIAMYGSMELEELNALIAFVGSSETFIFNQIIPANTPVLTYNEVYV
jgi:hypothetical protein|tara:strand:+ start:1074 stop:1649 length:576 start_codon:yes stop_codon:yes gene_type:complete